MSEERDDGRRANVGVVVCLRDLGDGRSRLIFDDVVAEPEDNPSVWRFDTFYTWNTYDNSEVDEMQLSNEQFEKIGAALVAPAACHQSLRQVSTVIALMPNLAFERTRRFSRSTWPTLVRRAAQLDR